MRSDSSASQFIVFKNKPPFPWLLKYPLLAKSESPKTAIRVFTCPAPKLYLSCFLTWLVAVFSATARTHTGPFKSLFSSKPTRLSAIGLVSPQLRELVFATSVTEIPLGTCSSLDMERASGKKVIKPKSLVISLFSYFETIGIVGPAPNNCPIPEASTIKSLSTLMPHFCRKVL